MTVTKIYCDHCKKELDEMKDHVGIEIDADTKWQKVDLCEGCHERLWRIINDFCMGCYTGKLVTDIYDGCK